MKLNFFKLLAVLLAFASCLNWQSAGNMSSQNVSEVNSYINTKFTMGSEDTDTLPTKVGPFSDHLNDIWDPAWNVVIIFNSNTQNFDSVVFGYAFRNHWMWINGLALSASSSIHYGSFIIWKDYNCQGWITLNQGNSKSTFASSPYNAISTSFTINTPKYDDIWNIAYNAVTYLQTQARDFQYQAYTMIFSQASSAYYFGRVCASKYQLSTNNNLLIDFGRGSWGSYLLLKMRTVIYND